MVSNFIYFTSLIIQICFLGYARVSQTIWLNFIQETKKCFKQQEYELKLKIWSFYDETLVKTIKKDIWNIWFGARISKLWHFEDAAICKTKGFDFYGSDSNLSRDFYHI
jgi:hypothetical protein